MRTRKGLAVSLVLVAAAIGLAACNSGGSAQGSNGSGATKVVGGTAYFAEPPGAPPNYIFPFMPFKYFSVDNISQFQYLMYRPLYWFGNGSNPTLNLPDSLANYPTFSNGNKTVTVTLKPYVWSNGEKVTAQDVVFWMNIMKLEYGSWAGFVPGTIPVDVKSIATPNATTVVFNLDGPVNPYWWVYNELGQITPLPMAWDVTAVGQKGGSQACGRASYQSVLAVTSKSGVTPGNATAKNCADVFTFLSKESGYNPSNPKAANNSLSTYATNPLWQVVDGPWHLTSFNVSGQLTMKPNPLYSGPVKPSLSAFVELPFTSNTAEFNQLIGGKITVGYIPSEDITTPAKNPLVPGPNNSRVAGKFNLVPWYGWLINYFPLNFNSTDDNGEAGAVFRQLYFRQALQMLINQPGLIKQVAKGYGVPVYGPVPIIPKNSFSTSFEASNPYPYNPSKAKALLSSHGWTIVPNGSDTCTNAAKCGVPDGTQLKFNLKYASGSTQTAQYAAAETSAWSTAGIHVTASAETFDTIIGTATPCTGSSCKWDMGWWGGWVYAPDYWPSGGDLFQTGAASNAGSYSNPSMDTMVKQTNFGDTTLAKFENYTALQLPDIWEPGGTYQISEIGKNLHGASPQNPLLTIQPENWYFTK